MKLIDKLGINFLYLAIEDLKEDSEIKTFYNQYIQYLRVNGKTPEIRENPKKVARDNLCRVLDIYGNHKKEWLNALPFLSKDQK
jgi:hypothetical protein